MQAGGRGQAVIANVLVFSRERSVAGSNPCLFVISTAYMSFRPLICHFDRREKSVLELNKARFLTYVRNDKVGIRSE
jgi:hypothetical protein